MIKRFILIMTAVAVCAAVFCGCGSADVNSGSAPDAEETVSTWTRTGTFSEANENYLSVTPSNNGKVGYWYIGVMLGSRAYGGTITEKGNSLQGTLGGSGTAGIEVTVKEEKDGDGLILTVKGGRTYVFSPLTD